MLCSWHAKDSARAMLLFWNAHSFCIALYCPPQGRNSHCHPAPFLPRGIFPRLNWIQQCTQSLVMHSALLKKKNSSTLLTAKEILSITIFLIPQFLLGNKNSEMLNYDRTIIFISFELMNIFYVFFLSQKKNILVCRFFRFSNILRFCIPPLLSC